MFILLIVALLALAATSADARPRSRFHWPKRYRKPANNGYRYTRRRYSSGVKCKAVAGTKNFKKSISAHVKAITEAWAYACDSYPYDYYDWNFKIHKRMRRALAKYDYGLAYAKAIAAAKTSCTSYGNAYGCAAAYAYSSAWAKATFKAHAKAWAEAVSKCDCDYKEQVSAAKAKGKAWEFKKVVAKVKALAKSKVCVKGYQRKRDYDAQTCVQDIYGTVWARSISYAALKGRCVSKKRYKSKKAYGKFLAKAEAEAKASIDIAQIKGCVGYIDLYNPYH